MADTPTHPTPPNPCDPPIVHPLPEVVFWITTVAIDRAPNTLPPNPSPTHGVPRPGPEPDSCEIGFWHVSLKLRFYTINETRVQYSLLDTIFEYICTMDIQENIYTVAPIWAGEAS